MALFAFWGEVQTTDKALQAVVDSIKALQKVEVLVGVPQEESGRKEGSITNAELLYIHTNGSTVKGIPARPVLEPAIQDGKEELGLLLKEAIEKALDGDTAGAMAGMEQVGQQGENIAKAWFTNPKNGWTPNAEYTVLQKGSNRPLIDTGQLRKSIRYVIRER